MNSSSVTNTAGDLHKAIVTSLVIVALILNTVCITLTGRIAYRKPQWPNILVVQVGIVDLCMLFLVLLPGTVALYLPEILHQLHFCRYQGTVLNMWYITEYLLLAQIMFDRYLAVTHPFVYNKRILNNKALIWPNVVFLGITIIALFIGCLPLATSIEFLVTGPGFCFWDASQDNALPVSTINVAVTLTTLTILIILTGGICIGVLQMLRRSHDSDINDIKKKGNKTEINFAKLAIITSLIFGASSIPFTVVIVLQMAGQYIDRDVQYIGLCILMVSVLLNPLLHSTIRRPVRRALVLLIKWLLYIILGCRSTLQPATQIVIGRSLIGSKSRAVSKFYAQTRPLDLPTSHQGQLRQAQLQVHNHNHSCTLSSCPFPAHITGNGQEDTGISMENRTSTKK